MNQARSRAIDRQVKVTPRLVWGCVRQRTDPVRCNGPNAASYFCSSHWSHVVVFCEFVRVRGINCSRMPACGRVRVAALPGCRVRGRQSRRPMTAGRKRAPCFGQLFGRRRS